MTIRISVGAITGGIVGCALIIAAICVLRILRRRKRAQPALWLDLTEGPVYEPDSAGGSDIALQPQRTAVKMPVTTLPSVGGAEGSSEISAGQVLRSVRLSQVTPPILVCAVLSDIVRVQGTAAVNDHPILTGITTSKTSGGSGTQPPSSDTDRIANPLHEEPSNRGSLPGSGLPPIGQLIEEPDATASGVELTLEQVQLVGSLYEQNLPPRTISSVISSLVRRVEGDVLSSPPAYEILPANEPPSH
jgi:hypothetical protein